jgi:tetratricopeptide (TPR) repeat protein
MGVLVGWLSGCAGTGQQRATLPPVENRQSDQALVRDHDSAVEVGVATTGQPFEPQRIELDEGGGEDESVAARSEHTNPAVLALLDDAGRYANDGQLDQAAAALERALRIDPRNAGIWHDLGELRYHQGDDRQAEALASRSSSLAGADNNLRRRNWRLIEKARRLRGDSAGAAQAAARAEALR